MDAGLDTGDGVWPLMRGLIMAVLGGTGESPAVADSILAEAEALGVDPLDYCAHRLGLGDVTVYERAAHWARFAFWSVVPDPPRDMVVDRVDGLADVRTVSRQVYDRRVAFCAPRFEELLRLAAARLGNEGLARRLCIVPPRAIRAALQHGCARQLMEEASQRLTRRWPQASANVDLSRPARVAFVLLFFLAVFAVAIAPMLLSAVLLPAVALLVLLPAILRLAVAFLPRPVSEPVPMLEDAELPVYTVLIPLRDEAGIRLFEAPQEGEAFPVHMNLDRLFRRRQVGQLCAEALVDGPLSTRDLALYIIRKKGWDDTDRHLRTSIALRIVQALRMQEKRGGAIKRMGKRGTAIVWAA